MKKALKLMVLFYIIYDDVKRVMIDLFKNKLDADGAIVLDPSVSIKGALIEQLSKADTAYPVSVLVYGGSKAELTCHALNIPTNHVYIYRSYNKASISKPICYIVDSEFTSDIRLITNAIDIPFHMRWLGYNSIHLEFFGDNSYISISNFKNEMWSSMPLGSTIIFTTSFSGSGLQSISDELILESFKHYIKNPFIRYLKYLLINADDNIIMVHTHSGIKRFTTAITTLTSFTDSEVTKWQQAQIADFTLFFQSTVDDISNTDISEFYDFIGRSIQYNNISAALAKLQTEHIVRYKELLLFRCLLRNEESKVALILEQNVDVNCSLLNGASPIYVAAYLGSLGIAKLLIDAGALLDNPRDNNSTALMVAALNNHYEIVELLLQNGADPNLYDINGNTALHLASSKGSIKIMKLLLASNTCPDVINKAGETPLSISITLNNKAAVEMLLDMNASIHLKTKNHSPIGLAINNSAFDIVELLISHTSISYNIWCSSKEHESILCDTEALKPFEILISNYILEHSQNPEEALITLNNAALFYKSWGDVGYIHEVQNCLLGLNTLKSYTDLMECKIWESKL